MYSLHDLNNCTLAITTVTQDQANEVEQITRAIDEYIFYDCSAPAKVLARPTEVISVLIKILVSNGAITLPQVQRALKTEVRTED
jgi:hypothetical protein